MNVDKRPRCPQCEKPVNVLNHTIGTFLCTNRDCSAERLKSHEVTTKINWGAVTTDLGATPDKEGQSYG